jgi:hypothetical protein
MAICFFANVSMWTEDGTLYRNTKIDVRASEKLSDYRFNKLNDIFNGFDKALEKLFV